jgi:hypothetical protein
MNALKRSSDNAPILLTVAVVAGLGVLSVLAGLLAATASPILVALGISVMLGGMLLLAPKLNLWLAITLGLGSSAILSMAGGAGAKALWGVVLLAVMLLLPVLLNMLTRPRLPPFMWLYLAFVAMSVAVSVAQADGVTSLITGLKRYHEAIGIALAIAVLPLDWRDDRRLRKILVWIVLLQLPFVLYEALVLVPKRIAMSAVAQGSQVTDVIAGTFGANLVGGSPNAEMVAFVLIMLAFAWSRWREGLLATSKLVGFIVVMLPCIGLGEVKFVVILFPLVALVLYKRDIVANPWRYLPVMAMAGLVTAAIVYLYFGYFSGSTVDAGLDDMVRYNLANVGYGRLYLNRTTVLTFWWQHQGLHDPIGFMFGHGAGSSYWTSDPTVPSGAIGGKFPYYGIALTTASSLLWDVGIVGTFLFLGVFSVAFVHAGKLYKEEQDPEVRSILLGIRVAIAIFIAFVPYSESMLSILPFQIVVALTLGYLARITINRDAMRAPATVKLATN